MKKTPSNKAKEILKSRKDSLAKNDFLPVLTDALEEDVCDEMLETFFESGISVPSEQLTSVLREYYVKKRIDISAEERAQKELRTQYLINKNQIAVFKALS